MQKEQYDTIIVGAGAAGLMAAGELGKAGQKVLLLEARDRLGGRIYSLPEDEFGYPAQGGAEFVHGKAPITRSLAAEAGLTYVHRGGDFWHASTSGLTPREKRDDFIATVQAPLRALSEDVPFAEFLRQYFDGDELVGLRKELLHIAMAYDAADPERISTFALRDDWLSGGIDEQGKISEGYGALVEYLARDCKENGVEIRMQHPVTAIDSSDLCVLVRTENSQTFSVENIIVTVPLPVLQGISITPAVSYLSQAIQDVGSGAVIKILLYCREAWWEHATKNDFSNMFLISTDHEVPVWWTQYPDKQRMLTGWLAGPPAEVFTQHSDERILEIALSSLAKSFAMSREALQEQVIRGQVFNWSRDPYALGGYSYASIGASAACELLRKPINHCMYLSGEALAPQGNRATVEGALASGKAVAQEVIAKG